MSNNRYHEAAALFEKCVALDPPDRRAMTQLAHELRERCAKAVAEGVTPRDVASLLEDHACRLRRMGARAALPHTSQTGPDSAMPR